MSFLDIENLQKLNYERSKLWSGLMEDISAQETLEEIDINELGNAYGPECEQIDSSDELASMEEDGSSAVDREALRNLVNTTRLSLYLNKQLPIREITRSEEQNELIDIVNQTLPIINESNRQMKEFGLDKILCTFDKKKIEEKVGSWLNRHNSLYGGDNTLLYEVPTKKYHDKQLTPNARYLPGKSNDNEVGDDTDDSLQSGETARYIRSSKTVSVRKSTNTMIKTYRKAKSTREALREKYACELDDEDRCHRKRASNIQHFKNRFDVRQFYKNHEYEMTGSSSKQRRKVLRKRTHSNSCSTMDSSSDSDYSHKDCRKFNRKYVTTCRNAYSASRISSPFPYTVSADIRNIKSLRCSMKMPLARKDRVYYFSNAKAKLLSTSSSSSSSFGSVREKRRMIKRNADHLYDECRPYQRESVCECSNRRQLCDKFKHVADTSTEEWYVENCSPKKLRKTQSNKTKPVDSANKKLSSSTDYGQKDLRTRNKSERKTGKKIVNEIKPKPKSGTKRNTLKEETLNENLCVNSTTDNTKPCKSVTSTNEKLSSINEMCAKDSKKRRNKSKNRTSSKSKINLEKESLIESDIDELETAIEASKKLYEEELQMKLKKETEDAEKEMAQLRTVKKAVLRKTKTVTNSAQNARNTVKTRKNFNGDDESIKKLLDLDEDSIDSSSSATMSLSPVENLNSVSENPFAISQAIYNSTALCAKSEAYNRQIADQVVNLDEIEEEEEKDEETFNTVIEIKDTVAASSAVTSTTLHFPETNCQLTSKQFDTDKNEQNDVKTYGHHNGCDLVTSSTNIDLNVADTTNNKETEKTAQHNTHSNFIKNPLPKNAILIYTPDNRNMAPSNSFTSDGYLTITKEHLSGIIGKHPAEIFCKYYVGCKRFNSNATIYYIPPTTTTLNGDISLSDSADDLDYLGESGNLYVVNN